MATQFPQLQIDYQLNKANGKIGEPVRGNNWELSILDAGETFESISLFCKTAGLPTYSISPIEINHFNRKVKVAGAPDLPNITIEVNDVLGVDTAKALWNWFTSIYNPNDQPSATGLVAGGIGFAMDYKKNGFIAQYDSKGTWIRQWNLYGLWPTNCSLGSSLDYTSYDPMPISIDFSVDYAQLSI